MNGPSEDLQQSDTAKSNVFFKITAFVVVLFVVTVLALTSTIFGDPRAPIHRFLGQYGGILIAVEVAIALSCGLLALAVDRRAIVEQSARQSMKSADSGQALENTSPASKRVAAESIPGGDNS